MRGTTCDLDRRIAYRVAKLFIESDETGEAIKKKVEAEFKGLNLKREEVYRILREARRMGLFRLMPPAESLHVDVEDVFKLPRNSVTVVGARGAEGNTAVSHAAAELVADLIKRLHQNRRPDQGPILIGLGPGRATHDFATRLGEIMLHENDMPVISLVAVSGGCPADLPEYASTSLFSLFPRERVAKTIGLFAGTLAGLDRLPSILERPGVREAYAEKDNIDIIVAAVGSRMDPHSLYARCYDEPHPPWMKDCIGDIQFRPYAETGPIIEGSRSGSKDSGASQESSDPKIARPVTLYEIKDLVRIAKGGPLGTRHVVLMARQCSECGKHGVTRTREIRPLLEQPSLRAFTHILFDSDTANELLAGHVVQDCKEVSFRCSSATAGKIANLVRKSGKDLGSWVSSLVEESEIC